MKNNYNKTYDSYVKRLEERLEVECKLRFAANSSVGKAAHYSLMAGGKRVRGVLVLAFCDLLGAILKQPKVLAQQSRCCTVIR